jgi:hypothetical protein
MSEERVTRVSVRLLDREYQVACPADERSALLDSAEYLDAKMREVRDSGKVAGLDRIAISAPTSPGSQAAPRGVARWRYRRATEDARARRSAGKPKQLN